MPGEGRHVCGAEVSAVQRGAVFLKSEPVCEQIVFGEFLRGTPSLSSSSLQLTVQEKSVCLLAVTACAVWYHTSIL